MHPLDACEAGMDGVQHMGSFVEALSSVSLEEDKMATSIAYMLSPEAQPLYDCLRDNNVRVTPTLIIYKMRALKLAGNDDMPQRFIDFINAHGAMAKRMHDEEIILLAGTDASDYDPEIPIQPGISLLGELQLLETAGIPPKDIITIATLNAAEAVGMRMETGTIETGKVADMLLLTKDPAESTLSFHDIRHIFKAGNIVNTNAAPPQ